MTIAMGILIAFVLGALPVACVLAGYWLGFREGNARAWRDVKRNREVALALASPETGVS